MVVLTPAIILVGIPILFCLFFGLSAIDCSSQYCIDNKIDNHYILGTKCYFLFIVIFCTILFCSCLIQLYSRSKIYVKKKSDYQEPWHSKRIGFAIGRSEE